MANPQQPEQDAVSTVIEGQRIPGADGPGGPVPPDNQPGHHPSEEQDKPDLDAFAAKLGTMEPSERAATPVTGDSPAVAVSGPRRVPAGVAAAVVTLVALVALVVAGRRRRLRRSRS